MYPFLTQGVSQLLNEDVSVSSGLNEVLIKNIEACEDLQQKISSSFGPCGMDKLIVQKTGKILISSDTVTILNNLKFIHPASKILVFSALFQEQELGDSAGFVILLSTEILKKAYELLNLGFSTSEIVKNFEETGQIALKILETLAIHRLTDFQNLKLLSSILSISIKEGDKKFCDHITPQVAFACLKTFVSLKKKFSKDNIRVIKILGNTISQTRTIMGVVILKDSEGSVKSIKKANICIFGCLLEVPAIETKNSILFRHPEEILTYGKSETEYTGEKIRGFFDKGINVVIASGFSEIALHFLEKFEIMAIKIQSKFDLRRISTTSGATVLTKIKTPEQSDIGKCEFVSVRSFASQKVTVFQQEIKENKIFTIVARGSTSTVLDKIERTVHRITSVFKSITRDNRFVPGAGASELEIYRRIKKLSFKRKEDSEKIILEKFAEAFEIIPLILLENCGSDAIMNLSLLHNIHSNGNEFEGVDTGNLSTLNSKQKKIWDSFPCKYWATKHAIDAAITILTVDQIIMSREYQTSSIS
mmetsp:Transcript_55914/g.114267  ORF Transcript_55914/g.114267 Transcript_55914/m.114267 type:complete len:534 (+) Transcript_55914:1753-3354(+)